MALSLSSVDQKKGMYQLELGVNLHVSGSISKRMQIVFRGAEAGSVVVTAAGDCGEVSMWPRGRRETSEQLLG